MKWFLQDVSPSAAERGRKTGLQFPKSEEVHRLVDKGTVHLYFCLGDPDLSTEEGQRATVCSAIVQFWQGWVNRVNVIKGENDLVAKAVKKAFEPFQDDVKMTSDQIVEAINSIPENL